MSLQDCETEFLGNNLALLAQQYNINIADAEIMQAKIWDLPVASLQINAYNPEGKKVFDAGQSKGAEVSQLIYLGGKKKNEIAFAKSNKELAQLQFNQLLVDLRSQLRSSYFGLYFEGKKLENLNTQHQYMSDLLSAYKVQTAKGNISLKDQVRLQNIVIQLNSDKIEINNNSLAFQQNLKLLTGISEKIIPELSDEDAHQILILEPTQDIIGLQKNALENNADYLYSQKLIDNSKLFASWQKSLNVPDLNLGASWDQNGGTFRNEVNLNFGIPIPLWKTNKGNVEKANFQVQQNQKSAEYQKLNLETQVEAAYQTWHNQYEQFFSINSTDLNNLEVVYKGMMDNFRKGNVNFLEFTDFMESYRESVLQVYDMKKQILLSAEQLSQLVQSKIYY